MAITSKYSFAHEPFENILDDLSVRFIINCPPEELSAVERVCFQVEEAQWFYEDFIREENPQLPSISLRDFTSFMFARCPLLAKFSGMQEKAFEHFMLYKTRVPVRGAILLNEEMDKCILVKGWKSNSAWGFPKGKINKDEQDLHCAAREVLEETGFDCSSYLNEKDFIEFTIREQNVRLYIARNVPLDSHFEPLTRKEISKIEWHSLSSLPTWSKKSKAHQLSAKGPKFYLVVPFLNPLKKFIHRVRAAERKAAGGVSIPEPFLPQQSAEEETKALRQLLGIQPAESFAYPPPLPSSTSAETKQDISSLLALLHKPAKQATSHRLETPEPNENADASLLALLKKPSHVERQLEEPAIRTASPSSFQSLPQPPPPSSLPFPFLPISPSMVRRKIEPSQTSSLLSRLNMKPGPDAGAVPRPPTGMVNTEDNLNPLKQTKAPAVTTLIFQDANNGESVTELIPSNTKAKRSGMDAESLMSELRSHQYAGQKPPPITPNGSQNYENNNNNTMPDVDAQDQMLLQILNKAKANKA